MNSVKIGNHIINEEGPTFIIAEAGINHQGKMKNAIECAMKIGAHTYLYKPFEIDDLLQHLTEIHRKQLAKVLG